MNAPLLNLKAEIARTGITKTELAEKAGMHYSSLNNKINGVTNFSIEEAFKICDALGQEDIRKLFAKSTAS